MLVSLRLCLFSSVLLRGVVASQAAFELLFSMPPFSDSGINKEIEFEFEFAGCPNDVVVCSAACTRRSPTGGIRTVSFL